MFGGGGHVQAAGFKIESSNFEETERFVTEKIKAFQKERLGFVVEEGTVSSFAETTTPAIPAAAATATPAEIAIETDFPSAALSEVEEQTEVPTPNQDVDQESQLQPGSAETDLSFTDVIVRQRIVASIIVFRNRNFEIRFSITMIEMAMQPSSSQF